MTPLGLGGTPPTPVSHLQFYKSNYSLPAIPSLVVLEAAAALLRAGGSALLCLPMLFIMLEAAQAHYCCGTQAPRG